MICYAGQNNQIRPAEGILGSRPFCIATSAGFSIGEKMRKEKEVWEFTGMKLGKLTVLGYARHKYGQTLYWFCQCECGNKVERSSETLRHWAEAKLPLNCGCLRKAQPKQEEIGYVYLMRCKDTDYYKIGFAINPKMRLSHIETTCPHKVILISTLPGTQKTERQLQRQFRKWRIKGEWFCFQERMIDKVKESFKIPVAT